MDYKKIGLKSGIEIHAQLDASKLFCECPSEIRDDQPDTVIKRRLRAAAGETGEIDIAAMHEAERGKEFIYQAYADTVCLVELDEEPPHNANQEALNIALQIALLLKAKPVDKIQFMRKTVVDGSNTSGFQRTALIAKDGFIETSQGKVRIPTICLEEDAAKIIKRTHDYDVYNLSRLGIPLVEIGTAADIKSPEHAREVAEKLGMVLRSTKTKRGLGTIRQDVNVSIKEGARIEIKGAQDLRAIAKLVENEALRQKNLVDVSKELKKGLKGKEIAGEKIVDITPELKNSESKIIKKAEEISAAKLKDFKGFLGKEIQPGRRLGTELSDYAKVIGGVGGIIHSDELPGYGIKETEVQNIEKKLNLGKTDAFVLVADKKNKTEKATKAALRRAEMALSGVPEEVRKANPDATTSFLRPIPGASRMYPETDIPLITPDIKDIKLPKLRVDRASELKELGLGDDLANKIVKENKDESLIELVNEFENLKPAFIAETIVSYKKELMKEKLDSEKIEKITEAQLKEIFSSLDKGKIAKQSVMEALKDTARGQELNLKKYELMSDEELKAGLKKIIAENKGMPLNALIGKAMARLRGKADGKKIVEELKRLIQF